MRPVAQVLLHDGLYFVAFYPGAGSTSVSAVSKLPADPISQARLWAARMFVDGDGLLVSSGLVQS